MLVFLVVVLLSCGCSSGLEETSSAIITPNQTSPTLSSSEFSTPEFNEFYQEDTSIKTSPPPSSSTHQAKESTLTANLEREENEIIPKNRNKSSHSEDIFSLKQRTTLQTSKPNLHDEVTVSTQTPPSNSSKLQSILKMTQNATKDDVVSLLMPSKKRQKYINLPEDDSIVSDYRKEGNDTKAPLLRPSRLQKNSYVNLREKVSTLSNLPQTSTMSDENIDTRYTSNAETVNENEYVTRKGINSSLSPKTQSHVQEGNVNKSASLIDDKKLLKSAQLQRNLSLAEKQAPTTDSPQEPSPMLDSSSTQNSTSSEISKKMSLSSSQNPESLISSFNQSSKNGGETKVLSFLKPSNLHNRLNRDQRDRTYTSNMPSENSSKVVSNSEKNFYANENVERYSENYLEKSPEMDESTETTGTFDNTKMSTPVSAVNSSDNLESLEELLPKEKSNSTFLNSKIDPELITDLSQSSNYSKSPFLLGIKGNVEDNYTDETDDADTLIFPKEAFESITIRNYETDLEQKPDQEKMKKSETEGTKPNVSMNDVPNGKETIPPKPSLPKGFFHTIGRSRWLGRQRRLQNRYENLSNLRNSRKDSKLSRERALKNMMTDIVLNQEDSNVKNDGAIRGKRLNYRDEINRERKSDQFWSHHAIHKGVNNRDHPMNFLHPHNEKSRGLVQEAKNRLPRQADIVDSHKNSEQRIYFWSKPHRGDSSHNDQSESAPQSETKYRHMALPVIPVALPEGQNAFKTLYNKHSNHADCRKHDETESGSVIEDIQKQSKPNSEGLKDQNDNKESVAGSQNKGYRNLELSTAKLDEDLQNPVTESVTDCDCQEGDHGKDFEQNKHQSAQRSLISEPDTTDHDSNKYEGENFRLQYPEKPLHQDHPSNGKDETIISNVPASEESPLQRKTEPFPQKIVGGNRPEYSGSLTGCYFQDAVLVQNPFCKADPKFCSELSEESCKTKNIFENCRQRCSKCEPMIPSNVFDAVYGIEHQTSLD